MLFLRFTFMFMLRIVFYSFINSLWKSYPLYIKLKRIGSIVKRNWIVNVIFVLINVLRISIIDSWNASSAVYATFQKRDRRDIYNCSDSVNEKMKLTETKWYSPLNNWLFDGWKSNGCDCERTKGDGDVYRWSAMFLALNRVLLNSLFTFSAGFRSVIWIKRSCCCRRRLESAYWLNCFVCTEFLPLVGIMSDGYLGVISL